MYLKNISYPLLYISETQNSKSESTAKYRSPSSFEKSESKAESRSLSYGKSESKTEYRSVGYDFCGDVSIKILLL